MAHIEWHPSLSTGLTLLDDQHKKLILLANSLIEGLHSEQPHDLIVNIFKELHEYSLYHFDDEERYMAVHGYPGLKEHQAAHARIREGVKDIQRRLASRSPVPAEEIRLFMKDWLVNHIIAEDGKIGRHVRRMEAESPTP